MSPVFVNDLVLLQGGGKNLPRRVEEADLCIRFKSLGDLGHCTAFMGAYHSGVCFLTIRVALNGQYHDQSEFKLEEGMVREDALAGDNGSDPA